jgi:hypothetical protein
MGADLACAPRAMSAYTLIDDLVTAVIDIVEKVTRALLN